MAEDFLYADKNFMQRVYYADNYRGLVTPAEWDGPYDYGEGLEVNSHLMSWDSAEDGYYVYPTVVQLDPNSPTLTKLNPDEAYEYARQTGEFVRFDTPEEAATFAEDPVNGYKQYWNAGIPNGSTIDEWTQNQREMYKQEQAAKQFEQMFTPYTTFYDRVKSLNNLEGKVNEQ